MYRAGFSPTVLNCGRRYICQAAHTISLNCLASTLQIQKLHFLSLQEFFYLSRRKFSLTFSIMPSFKCSKMEVPLAGKNSTFTFDKFSVTKCASQLPMSKIICFHFAYLFIQTSKPLKKGIVRF